jgi:hypothetical protein
VTTHTHIPTVLSTLVVALVACALVIPGAAHADLGEPFPVAAGGEVTYSPQVTIDNQGRTRYAWSRGGIVETRRRAADGTLGPVEPISEGSLSSLVEVASDAEGNTFFLWTQPGAVRARRQAADGSLGPIHTLTASAGVPRLTLDGEGGAIVAWQTGNSPGIVEARRIAADGSLGAVQQVASAAWEPRVGADADGNGYVAFLAWDSQLKKMVLRIRRWPAGGGLEPPIGVASADLIDNPDLAVGPQGEAYVIWRDLSAKYFGRRLASDQSLGATVTLSTASETWASTGDVAVDGLGRAHFAWMAKAGSLAPYQVWTRMLTSAAAGTAQQVSSEPVGVTGATWLVVAADGVGGAVFAWDTTTADELVTRVRRRAWSGSFGETQSFANAWGPDVAVDGDGTLVATFNREDQAGDGIAHASVDPELAGNGGAGSGEGGPGSGSGEGGSGSGEGEGGSGSGGGSSGSGGGGTGETPDTTAPVMASLTVSPGRFRAGRKAVVKYTVSESARVRFRVLRRAGGRRVGGKCVRRTAVNARRKPCDLLMKGALLRAAAAGANGLTMKGRIGGRYLTPGRYYLVATAVDAAGNRSAKLRRSFRITSR